MKRKKNRNKYLLDACLGLTGGVLMGVGGPEPPDDATFEIDHVDPDVYVLRGWENPKYIAEPVLVAVERSIRDPWTDGGADPNN